MIKQRIARKGQGKNGGYRSIIFFKRGDKAFFTHAFAKSDRENISVQELLDFKTTASNTLALNDEALRFLIDEKELQELNHE